MKALLHDQGHVADAGGEGHLFSRPTTAGDERRPIATLVVFARGPNTLRVAVEDSDDALPEDETWRVELAADEVARRRQKAGMQAARGAKRDRLAELRDVLMGRREPAFVGHDSDPVRRLARTGS